MKKTMKRIASIVLAMAMMFTMAMPAMASSLYDGAETYTITIENEKSGHTYVAYQIFKGTKVNDAAQGEEKGRVLSNIDWGSGLTQDAINALKADGEYESAEAYADAVLKDDAAAKALADMLTGNSTLYLQKGMENFENGEGEYTLKDVPAGYYLIIDKADSLDEAVDDAYTSYIIQVVGATTVKAKSEVPSIEKTVEDDDDKPSNGGDNNAYGETADHQIGEVFNFKLEATIPGPVDNELENYLAEYEKYKLIFHDTLSKGLTYDGNEHLTINVIIDGTSYAITPDSLIKKDDKEDGTTELTITIEDLLSEDLSIAAGGHDAIMNAFAKKEFKVEVIYQAHLNKDAVVAESKDEGAVGDNFNTNKVYLEYSNNPNGKEEGTGKTTEDTVYVFTYELPTNKVDENGKAPLAGAKFKLYDSATGGNEIKLAWDADGKFYYPTDGEGEEMISHEDGKFTIRGLDIGKYYLEEIESPEGYNRVEGRTEITITADNHGEDDVNAHTKFEISKNTTIENHKGTTLPETGGMGTTVFYVVGSVLVLAAVVLLVTKRRMSAE